MHIESEGPDQTAAPQAEHPPDAAEERTIEATYRDGVLHPREPLHLPPDTPLRLRVALPAAAPVPAAPAAAADEPPPEMPALPHALLLALLGGALALGALGQYMLLETGGFTWPALACYLLAVLLFGLALTWRDHTWLRRLVVAVRRDALGPDATPAAPAHGWMHHAWRWPALVVALVLTLVLLWQLQREPPLESYNWGLPVWLAAIGLYLAAVAAGSRGAEPTAEPAHPGRRWLLLGLLALVLLAFGLRIWHLGQIPETLGGDEGSQGLEAMRVLEGEISNPFGTGWLGVPTMSFYFNALSIGPLGNTIFALRLPWVLVGTLTVLVMFVLVRRLSGLTLGLLTAGLLATYHYHIHFSRLGSNQVADALFVALALWLLYRGYDRRSALDWALCGIVVGAAQFFYAGARFTAVVTIAVLGFLALRDGLPFIRQRWRAVLALTGAVLLSAAPMIQYAIRFPNEYDARVNQVGVIQSGWLEQEQEIRGEGPLPILFDQAKRAFLAFNLYPDRNVWYGSSEPLLHGVAAALFVLGVGYASLHLWNRRMFPMVAWWGGATILGGVLTESPPSSQRLITLAAPAMFFVALALVKIGEHVFQPGMGRTHRRLYTAFLGGAAVVITLLSLHWYFIEFTPQRRYGGYNGVVATSIGKYARDELGEEWQMYFAGPPRMYIGFGSIPYIAPEVEGVDFHDPLTEPLDPDIVAPDKHAVFILLPERRDELQMIRATFPRGELEVVPSPVPGIEQPLYLLYRVPREQISAQGAEG
jgi:hypothetical protein